MALVHSLSLCARVTLDLHSLNNEGTEGNQQQTRMVHIIDQRGQRAVVNAVSGDMFKHILVEHLIPLLQEVRQPLSTGAAVGNPDRVNQDLAVVMRDSLKADDLKGTEKKWLRQAITALGKSSVLDEEASEASEPESDAEDADDEAEGTAKGKKPSAPALQLASSTLRICALTDITGTLMTMKRPALSLGRKSVVEFGWVVGLPEDGAGQALTTTEQYFHVKYAQGREAATGGETVAGKQAIFHRPASSGIYALICNLDLYRIGLNDITRKYVVAKTDRKARAKSVVHALASTLLKPTGAQRNTQNPHIVSCEGVVASSSTSLPAPTVSPLNDNYRDQITQAATVLNGIRSEGVAVRRFETLADGVSVLAGIAADLDLPGD
jgi:CRISPR-associated protein Cst2